MNEHWVGLVHVRELVGELREPFVNHLDEHFALNFSADGDPDVATAVSSNSLNVK